MVLLFMTSCYLYTGACRVEQVGSAPLTERECSMRAQALTKSLAHSIGDDGWTPVGVTCSLKQDVNNPGRRRLLRSTAPAPR